MNNTHYKIMKFNIIIFAGKDNVAPADLALQNLQRTSSLPVNWIDGVKHQGSNHKIS